MPRPLPTRTPLVDTFGRVHTSLRLSVTDRCNIRCFYCMPAEGVRFLPRADILSFEEISRFVRVVAAMGVSRIRLTGGEPLVRTELSTLVAMLRDIDGVEEIALTTNGMLLGQQADGLKRAGLDRLNISLDTLDATKFERIARRSGFDQVLEGIDAAIAAGFENVRLNALAIRGETEDEIVPLVVFATSRGLVMRFIEYMPLDADGAWQHDQVLAGEVIRETIERELGPLVPVERSESSQPAVDYEFVDGRGRVGFINPVSEPFCGACDRLRLTAEGQVRNCLFSTTESDARSLLRGGASDEELEQLVRDSIQKKKPGHGIDDQTFLRPQRAMYQIGG
ncbi:GTP 3',8-cyclase MoaA [Aeoliella sp. SH292]|uniref:GTP 3',8-cyclase MoaA n=1 Tax=Aeoliella sp. SH292 TaxID=3454464 RepID=UPI003F96B7E1